MADPSSLIKVLSISRKIYGERIMPGSFLYTDDNSNTISDDGKGNLFLSDFGYVGNIIYSQGILVLISVNIIYPISISFTSEYTIYEHNIICQVRDSDYNLTYNRSLIDPNSADHELFTFATDLTGSFVPYATSIGIYNDQNDLLAVAKLASPIPISKDTDMAFHIRYDV